MAMLRVLIYLMQCDSPPLVKHVQVLLCANLVNLVSISSLHITSGLLRRVVNPDSSSMIAARSPCCFGFLILLTSR